LYSTSHQHNPPNRLLNLCFVLLLGCVLQEWSGTCCPAGYKCVRNDAWYYNCQGNMNSGGNNGGGSSSGNGGSSPIAFKPDPPVPAKKLPNGRSSVVLAAVAGAD
jgi:hypothetical protein